MILLDTDQLAAFQAFGLPGMTLNERPLVPRCACGKRISANKSGCKACNDLSPLALFKAGLLKPEKVKLLEGKT